GGDVRVARLQRQSVDRFTVHYDDVAVFTPEEIEDDIDPSVSADRSVSFQYSLRADRNEIEFHYGAMIEGPNSLPEMAIVGLYSTALDAGWLHAMGSPALRPGLSFRIQP